MTAVGHTSKPPRLAQLGTVTDASEAVTTTRDVWFGDGWVTTPVIDGERLGPGATVTGPALVEEPFTVVVVPDGATLTLHAHTSYELELAR
jgi:N-methylhydantoinase A